MAGPARAPRRAIIVSHTHWDREWYRPFQEFRLALLEVLDELIDALDAGAGPPVALLDGQTILLDDYLQLRPWRRDAVRRHTASGRLIVGPWYVQPDEFLVSGEALVRNLLRGRRGALAYGGVMAVGYLADQFGHIAQLPQLLRGFAIESAVFWRGRARDAGGSEFWWEAPDGSRVLAVHLSDGYGNAAWLPLEPAALARRIEELCDSLDTTATTPTRLLMNGMDHQRFQVRLAEALEGAAPLLEPDLSVQVGGLETYVEAVRADGLPVERGEYRSPRSTPLLPGVLSTRAGLKRRNARLQTLLEREAEPWSALAAALGLLPRGYPQPELDLAWDYLLQNHPHDSICGCSLDQVAREMDTRFDWAEQVATQVAATATERIAAAAQTRPPWWDVEHESAPPPGRARDWGSPSASLPNVVALVTFNAADIPRTDRARVTMTLPGSGNDYEVIDAEGAPVPHRWLGEHGTPSTEMEVAPADVPAAETVIAQIPGNRVMDMGVHDARIAIEGDAIVVDLTLGEQSVFSREEIEEVVRYTSRLLAEARPARAVLRVHRSTRLELEYLAREVPPHGYATVWLRRKQPAAAAGRPAPGPGGAPLETDLFALRLDRDDGAFTIVDRRDGTVYGGCNVMEDGGDAGDTYTYAPPARDLVVRGAAAPPDVTVEDDPLGVTVRVAMELRVPAALAASRARRGPSMVALPIVSTIQLTHGVPRVDITTTVENTAQDHRLRVSFRTPVAADHAHAEDIFAITRRPLGSAPDTAAWAEQPAATAPQQGFVAVHGSPGAMPSLLIANQGLPEYEVRAASDGGTEVLVTLLRCVGWLSRDDLSTRRDHAGPGLPTPEAQCPGTHTASYSVLPHHGPWRDAVPLARAAACPLRAVAITLGPASAEATLPARVGLLQVTPPGLVVSALKGAEDGDGLILRLCNLTGAPVEDGCITTAGVLPPLRVRHATLAETSADGEPARTLEDGDGGLPLAVAPHGIITLRLHPGTRPAPRASAPG